MYYKDTNAHDYLPYNSAHPKLCKDNVPYNFAKRIIVFVSSDAKVDMRLKELKNWLKDCNYPKVINQSLYNAKLQGPVSFTENLKNIPLVTTYYKSTGYEKVVWKSRSKLSTIQSRHLSATHNLALIINLNKIQYRNQCFWTTKQIF